MEIIPPHVLLGAYTEGVFPMAEEGEILWFSPLKRGVIPLDDKFQPFKGFFVTSQHEEATSLQPVIEEWPARIEPQRLPDRR